MPVRIIPPTPSAYVYPLLIKHLLHTSMTRAPDQEIVYRDLRRRTYREFRERIGRLASGLTQIGVDQGDVVAILEWDSDRYHECYFAIPMMGAVMQTVNVSLTPEDIAYTIVDSGATTVLFNADFAPLVAKLRPHLEAVRNWVSMLDRPDQPVTAMSVNAEYEALLSIGSPYFPFPDFDENAVATIFHTTGTTGRPKGVHFSHRQIVMHSMAVLVEYGLTPKHGRFHRDDVYMPMTPMFHVHAWGAPYTTTLAGCKLVFPGRYSPEIFVKLIASEGVTWTHCVPTLLQMLLTAPGSESVDLSRLRMVIGGSALPPSLARAAMARGIDVFGGYGMSETAPMLTTSHIKSKHLGGDFEEELRYRIAAGIAAPLVDLRIVDANMAEVPHDGEAVGEIVVRAPWLTTGYLNNPEASEVLWGGGYLHTGDVASIDADGYVRIADRIKDIVKTGGEWVSSIALENIIMEMPGVRKAAVIPIRDVKWGERPLALVIRDPEHPEAISEDDVRLHVASYVERGLISKIAIPENVTFVAELPLTSVGKIDKKTLRALYS
ncbi:fatty-acyl-CoA synthase [Roseiarcus fermentans]|uniref:Fatty-acyl-CoA synthase n=1 Tax=Roseiarcus fermentans TaxID=1473586 RepID=A0A366ETG2_9HYPH|nr:fatty acid--CoA ligase [Roseiarcus fermentans]RBP05692.1 fatty-acyl-CoA synthase [Roseiarcus fermentans]